jgi:TRAP-type mannitol/chloroaromatic compound transport system substrate-binding protein
MKGLKMIATEPMDVEVLNALGASAILMPEGEVYTSLERGLADGRVHQADGMITHKSMEVTKFRTFNANIKLNALQIVMNLDTWKSLPSDLQCKIDAMNSLEMSHHMGLVFDTLTARWLRSLKPTTERSGTPISIIYQRRKWRDGRQLSNR